MIFDRSYSFPTKAIDIKLCYGLSISKAFAKPDRYENGSRGCFMGNHGVRLGHVALRSALSNWYDEAFVAKRVFQAPY